MIAFLFLTAALLLTSCQAQDPPSNDVVHRINCGATLDYTDSDGNSWSHDAYYQNGVHRRFYRLDLRTDKASLYGTYRETLFWIPFATTVIDYEFPVDDGDYAVEIYFPDKFQLVDLAFGLLRFTPSYDILAEGQLIFQDLEIQPDDLFFRVVSDPITVNDGQLSLRFSRMLKSPSIAAIVVYKV